MRNYGRFETLAHLLRSPRLEVIPAKGVEEAIVDAVPTDITITVTASPANGLDATLSLTERLTGYGYRVVPHVSARLVVDRVHLKEITDRLRGTGVEDVFVPAGDADPPAGKYAGALSMLADMDRSFLNVGITGYPESHPAIEDDVTIQAMWDKRQYATYIVSNLCFDPAVLTNWIARVRRRGVELPILVGLAGPVERIKLLKMATKIGVGESTRFLSQHMSWFLRLAAPSGYAPERLLDGCATAITSADARVTGLHLFTFNQVRETERWRTELLDRLG